MLFSSLCSRVMTIEIQLPSSKHTHRQIPFSLDFQAQIFSVCEHHVKYSTKNIMSQLGNSSFGTGCTCPFPGRLAFKVELMMARVLLCALSMNPSLAEGPTYRTYIFLAMDPSLLLFLPPLGKFHLFTKRLTEFCLFQPPFLKQRTLVVCRTPPETG